MLLVLALVAAGALAGWLVGHYTASSGTKTVTVAAGTSGATGATTPAAIEAAPAFSTSQLAALPTDNWITNGGSTFNQRYSSLDEIDTSNVSQLKGVWLTHLRKSAVAAKYSAESQPLEYQGIIYVPTGEDDV